MKILQLVTKRQYRGAEVFAANLSSELIDLGHEIIFCGLYQNEREVLQVENCLNVDLVRNKGLGFNFLLVQRLVQLIKDERPEIIQCNGSDTLKYMVAASYFVQKKPIVYRNISVISEWINSKLKLNLYKYLFRKIDHVTSVGSESIYDLITTLNFPKARTSVIRRGIPLKLLKAKPLTELRDTLGLKVSDKIVMHIGNFSPEKNHDFLIEIFTRLKLTHPDIKLVLVGTGIRFDEIKKKVSEFNLTDTVYLLGFRKDIPELLSQADCFALCSKVEGVPGVILEAGSQRKPSISTNVGGVNEVLIDNITGFIIEKFDKDEYERKLVTLINDEDLKTRMGEKAFQLVMEEFNPVKNAKKFEKLYEQLVGRKNKGIKILQLIQKKQYRGAEVFCCQISNHLVNLENTVEVVSLFEGNAILPFKGAIHSLNRRKSQRYVDHIGWRDLSRYIKKFEPDLVQANAADTLKYTVLSKMVFGWKTPIVYRNASTSSFYISNKITKIFNAFLLRKVDRIISVSKASKNDLNKLYPFTESKSEIIPVGIETRENIGSLPILEARSILHIGSFTTEKNHMGLFNIFQHVLEREKNATLYLVGEGHLKERIVNEVKRRGLEQQVIILNAMADPLPLIRAANVLVLPSLIEGLPGVLLEAMVSKTGVVAYDVGGVSEIVTERTGTTVPKGEERKFAEAVLKALQNPDEDKIERAYKTVTSRYLNEQIAQEFLKSYKELLKKKSSVSSIKIHA